ncbi:MAG: hypothetical protein AAB268_07295 [Elusimicrobiota bacterium]
MPKKNESWPLGDEERKQGIVRLLAEAYLNRLKRLGRLKGKARPAHPVGPDSRPEFLR